MEQKDDIIFELIEQYLREELSLEEKNKFEQRLKTDNEFARVFKVEQDIYINTAFLAEQDIQNRLKDIQAKFIEKKEKPTAKIVSFRKWVVAAAAILVGLVIGIYLLKPSTLSSDQLMAYYTKPAFEQNRGANDLVEAKTAYDAGKYEETLSFLQIKENEPELLLVKGICHFELQQMDQAITAFLSLQNNPTYNDQATWYLALTFLKNGNTERGISELEKLIATDGGATDKMKTRAREVLDRL